jgi:hypothetical protein
MGAALLGALGDALARGAIRGKAAKADLLDIRNGRLKYCIPLLPDKCRAAMMKGIAGSFENADKNEVALNFRDKADPGEDL